MSCAQKIVRWKNFAAHQQHKKSDWSRALDGWRARSRDLLFVDRRKIHAGFNEHYRTRSGMWRFTDCDETRRSRSKNCAFEFERVRRRECFRVLREFGER